MYKPKFTITPQINNRIAQIERIKEVVAKAKILPQKEITLRLRATVDAIHSSTTIEGNPLNKQQVRKVLEGKVVSASERAIIEVQNYKQALDWIGKRIRQPQVISVKDIFNLHNLTMEGLLEKQKVGRFRPGPIYIIDEVNGREQVRYVGPGAHEIRPLVSQLLAWLNQGDQKLHPILAAGILHYEFVSIHPFSDGNGRVTRLLVSLLLRLRDYGFREVLVPDTYYLQHRRQYYRALNQAKRYKDQRKADLTPWLEYFTEGFLEVAQELEKNITVTKIKAKDKEVVRLSQKELMVLDFAARIDKVSLQDVLDILEVPKRTAQRRLKELVEKGLLERKGKGRGTFYQLLTE